MLEHDSKPDYNLLKLMMATDEKDEKLAFKNKIIISNKRLANDFYDLSEKLGNFEKINFMEDQLDEFRFDKDCDEMDKAHRPNK